MVTLFKALIIKYRGKTDKHNKPVVTDAPKVQVWKLFARHISLKDQKEALEKTLPKGQKVINVYIATPNRLKELVKSETVNLDSKKFKMIVLDCSLNKKNCTMLETHETRDDCFDVIASAAPVLLKRKLKVYLSTLPAPIAPEAPKQVKKKEKKETKKHKTERIAEKAEKAKKVEEEKKE